MKKWSEKYNENGKNSDETWIRKQREKLNDKQEKEIDIERN